MTTYEAIAFRDENGAWCARVDELHANTDAHFFADLRPNLVEAVHVSIDPPVPPFEVELYVRAEDMAAAVAELGQAS